MTINRDKLLKQLNETGFAARFLQIAQDPSLCRFIDGRYSIDRTVFLTLIEAARHMPWPQATDTLESTGDYSDPPEDPFTD